MQDNLIVFPEPPPDHNVQHIIRTLPVSLTSLIGREHEVQAIQALLLRPEVRLLTLTGTAGVGKTRLALEVAREVVHDFADGVHVVSLAPLSDPALVIPTIAHSLGLMESGSQPLLELLKVSQRDKHRLLLLDNFEQVIQASTLLAELLEACPDLKLLVTSREVLRLRGEHQFAVPPLALPDLKHLPDAQSLARVPAVNLFLQRAQAIRSDFQLTTDNASAIAQICLRLDGLPLAIELAAARVKLLQPKALLARLDRRLSVLTGGARDLPERQRTLRNALAWSYELLTAQEQRLFRQFSVFVGGCTLEAAEAICGSFDNGAGQVLEGVVSLLDKSLLQQTESEGKEPRLMMLETLREFALERLATCEEMEATRQAHAAYYLALTEKAESELEGPQQIKWLEQLEQEHDNLRAALQWLIEKKEVKAAMRLGTALQGFWYIRGYWSEGRSYLERILPESKGSEPSLRAKALIATGSFAQEQGDNDRAEALLEEGMALCRELGDTASMADSLELLGFAAWDKGNFSRARSLLEEVLVLSREMDDKVKVAWALLSLGRLASQQGEYARARSLLEQSLAMHRDQGNKRGIAALLFHVAKVIFVSQEDPTLARSLVEESLTFCRELGDKEGIADSLLIIGQMTLLQDEVMKAGSLAEKSLKLYKEMGDRLGSAESLSFLARVEARQGDLTAPCELYREALTIASEMNTTDVIASCLEGWADVVLAGGQPSWATRLFGAAEVIRKAIGSPIPPVERAGYERSVVSVRAQLGEKAFAAAWNEGRSMTLEQVLVSLEPMPKPALTTPSPASVVPLPPLHAGLTPREMDVLRLLAQGFTSAQIAEQLVIGLVTVNAHVRSTYSKLGVTSRSAATRYALEHHLL